MYGISTRRLLGNGINPQVGDSWTIQNSGTTSFLSDVIWFANKFIAVGSSGAIYTSPDGVTWTQRTSNTTANLVKIACSSTLCIAVGGQTNSIVYSTDGITWTVGLASSSDIGGIDYVNGIFYANSRSGNTPIFYTSTNGSAWSSLSTGVTVSAYGSSTTSYISSISWTGSVYVATGSWSAFVSFSYYTGAFTLHSTNGTTWTKTGVGILNAEYDGTKFIGSDWGSGYFMESIDDGYTWTALGAPVTPYSGPSDKLTRIGSRLIIPGFSAGYTLTNQGNVAISDSGGTSWYHTNVGSTLGVNGLGYNGSVLVAVGQSGLIATSSI